MHEHVCWSRYNELCHSSERYFSFNEEANTVVHGAAKDSDVDQKKRVPRKIETAKYICRENGGDTECWYDESQNADLYTFNPV